MKKFLIFIYVFFFCGSLFSLPFLNNTYEFESSPLVIWGSKPANMQLFAREINDSADVNYSGSINSIGYDSIYVILYKNQLPIQRKSQSLTYIGSTANFYLSHRIKAELSEYSTRAYVKNNSANDLIDFSDSLVAGDVYLIMGQSNAQSSDTNVSFSSEYCRTFGIQTNNTNQDNYAGKDTLWAKASAKYNGFSPTTQNQPYNVGVWGMWLQKLIKDNNSIPTCVINGSVHSTGIKMHLRNNSNPMDPSTIYGKELYRTRKSGLASKVKSIFWYQGESDVISPVYSSYANKFDSLYNSLKIDYSGIEKIFVMQVRPLACNGSSSFAQELRETQREMETTYSDIQLIATVGISGYSSVSPSSNCHYDYKGYQQLAEILFKRVGQLYYGDSDTAGIRSPDIRKAWFTDSTKTKIAMLFDNSSPVRVPSDSLGNSIRNYFYLNKVAGFTSGIILSVTLSVDTLFLNLSTSTSAEFISYIPDMTASNGSTIYNGPWIRNARGLGVLTFDQIPILPPEPTSLNIYIKTIFEGMYLTSSGQMKRSDSATVYVRQSSSPYSITDSSRSKIDSVSLSGLFKFFNTSTGNYYLSIEHFNTLETWSKEGGISLINDGSTHNYDFTTSVSQAYGNNLKLIGGKFSIYSGDPDQSGTIDLDDIISEYNDSQNFLEGNHIPTDLNGDSFVNLNDLVICYNNALDFVGLITP